MIKRLVSLSLLLVLVAACTQAPQPLRHSRTGFDTTSLRLRDTGIVQILPVEGVSKPIGVIINTSLADSLAVRNVPATEKVLTNPTYKVRGQAITDFSQNDAIPHAIYWTFLDRNNVVIEETKQPISATKQQWDFGDQKMIDELVDEAADLFASYLQDASEAEAVKLEKREQPVTFVLTSIKGATGDGKKSLRRAMALTLRQYGARVTNKVVRDTYRLSAEIQILEPFENQQRIIIDWIVKDDKGNELGRNNLNNRVPAGSLDGKWGKITYAIAQAAVQGVGQIVERDRYEKLWENRSREVPATTAAPGKRDRRFHSPF